MNGRTDARRWCTVAGLALGVMAGCSEDPTPVDGTGNADVAHDGTTGMDVPTATMDAADGAIEETIYQTLDNGPDVPAEMDVTTDHGGTDAHPDVRTGDGGFYGGPSLCTGSGFTICDDFESGNWMSVWTPHMSSGTMTVDAMHVARGSHALHIHTATTGAAGGTGANVGLTSTHGFPAANNTYWGRAFVYMVASAAPTTHTTLFESGGSLTLDGGAYSVSQRFSISGGKLDASYDSSPRPPTTDYARRSATGMPLNRWACLEWEFKGNTNEVHYFLDDNELTDMAVTNATSPRWTAPMWQHVQVGLQLYRSDAVTTFDLWMDEVAVSPNRIRCEN